MRPEAIRILLRSRPFYPFRVYVSDRAAYDVPHPEAAEVVGMTLYIQVRAVSPGRRVSEPPPFP